MRFDVRLRKHVSYTAARVWTWQTHNIPCVLIKSRQINTRSPLSSPVDATNTDSHAPTTLWKPTYNWHEAVEDIQRYMPGGYHPVYLGDKFSVGRYEVVYTLGFGSYSTVWLCKDVEKRCYVSVKVGVSDTGAGAQRPESFEREALYTLRDGDPSHAGKRFVIALLDDFTLEGPNGRHQCFVFPVALNSVAVAKGSSISDNSMFPAQVARSIVTQLLLALSYIHSCGIVHTDLHTHNILIQAPSSKSWPLSNPYEHPEKLLVTRIDGAPIGSNVPKYQIEAAGIFTPSDTIAPDCKVLVTDFGEAFFMQSPNGASQRTELNTPILVRPLETIFGHPITSAADVWTLGMTIFDILGRGKLFQDGWPDEDTVVLKAISTFGPLPQNMWNAWPNRSKFFKDDGSLQEDEKWLASVPSRPLANRLRECMEHEDESKIYGYSDVELQSLEKMLRSMLRYEPDDRITVDQVLRSDWTRDYGIPALLKAVPDLDLSGLGMSQTIGAQNESWSGAGRIGISSDQECWT